MVSSPSGKSGSGAVIQVVVAELGDTEAFYAGILELPMTRGLTSPGAPGHLLLECEGIRVIFIEEAAVARNHPVLFEELSEHPKGTGVSFHFPVTEIEEIFAAVVEENLEIVYPLQSHPFGVKEFWCRDPDGYLVVLSESVQK